SADEYSVPLVAHASLEARRLDRLNGAGRLVVCHGEDAIDTAARVEAHQQFAGDLFGQRGVPLAVFRGDQLIARRLGQHFLESRDAVLDVELLRGAGDRDDLRLGLALGLQAFDHAFTGQAAQFT